MENESELLVGDYLGGSEQTLLLVEDNVITMFVTFSLIRKIYPTHNILVAYNGQEGLEKYLSSPPDIILTDISMPELTGYEMTSQIREIEKGLGRRIPIIAITCNANSKEMVKCLKCGSRCISSEDGCGIDGFFSKPIYASDLIMIMTFIHAMVT